MPHHTAKQGGVDRSHAPSLIQKTAFSLGHMGIVLACAWLAFSPDWAPPAPHLPDRPRAVILFGCALLYWARHAVTLFHLLARRVDWAEVVGLLGFIACIEVGLLLVGGGALRGAPAPPSWVDGASLALVLAGSFLNTWSEMQRKRFKDDPANKGRCYTGGLFKYAMHVNYFGDTVLFTGWSLFTRQPWALLLPALMAASFVLYHIPGLDAYLARRYGEEFTRYAAKTKKFIPFVY